MTQSTIYAECATVLIAIVNDFMENTASSPIDTMRRFNRFYTQKLGILQEGVLASPFSLTETRILFELAHNDGITATELGKTLGLDAGYVSRILKKFEENGFIDRQPSQEDARQNHLYLTSNGRDEFNRLNERAHADVDSLLQPLSLVDKQQLVSSLRQIETLLGGKQNSTVPSYILRPTRPGDLGWIIYRHGALYAEEYGWNERFEHSVVEIAYRYIQNYNPETDYCWIAEKDGENVGALVITRETDDTARLRLFFVEPKARGLGIGKRLVAEAVRFARMKGNKKVVLKTVEVLQSARNIYRQHGFKIVRTEPNSDYGRDITVEHWELDLD